MIFKTKIVRKLSVLLRMIILFETLIYKNKFISLDTSTAFLDYFNQFGVRSVPLPSLITRTLSARITNNPCFSLAGLFPVFLFFDVIFIQGNNERRISSSRRRNRSPRLSGPNED